MQLNSAGTDGYLEPGVLPEGTLLTNATGAYGLAISEHMLGMVLELKKKLYLYHQNQLAECWKDEGKVTSIFGSVTLVIGLGDIGSEFASRMKALGSYVIGIRPVSYTHLDVYKRQELTCAWSRLWPGAGSAWIRLWI